MRIVLIIQSLIILLGAYYVYTLTRTSSDSSNEEVSSSNIEVEVRREITPSVVNESDDEDNTAQMNGGGIIVTEGHNDLGMEFPIPDDENELEVR
ncbi:MAG: hypothetical protein ACK42D_03315 [Candidatus Paceibacteria bacterium]